MVLGSIIILIALSTVICGILPLHDGGNATATREDIRF
jgi:hypothetical protein